MRGCESVRSERVAIRRKGGRTVCGCGLLGRVCGFLWCGERKEFARLCICRKGERHGALRVERALWLECVAFAFWHKVAKSGKNGKKSQNSLADLLTLNLFCFIMALRKVRKWRNGFAVCWCALVSG